MTDILENFQLSSYFVDMAVCSTIYTNINSFSRIEFIFVVVHIGRIFFFYLWLYLLEKINMTFTKQN